MYNQQCPFYMQNMYQMQMRNYMRNTEGTESANMANPESMMAEQQLEMMYPRRYKIIYPVVLRHCDMFDNMYGSTSVPTREQIDRMTEEIYNTVEADIEATTRKENRETEVRQLGFLGGGFLRDLIGILLLREFIGRRRRPFHRTPYYTGY